MNNINFSKKLKRICLILMIIFPITNLLCKATLTKINVDVERTKRKIAIQENKNESLAMKVNELKSLTNIKSIVESEGLKYDCSKIKVIALLNE